MRDVSRKLTEELHGQLAKEIMVWLRKHGGYKKGTPFLIRTDIGTKNTDDFTIEIRVRLKGDEK